MKCRHCAAELTLPFVDLGSAPPSNAYLTAAQLHAPEKWYPLRTMVCTTCWLVQTEDYVGADEMFVPDYAYFSSYSSTWLAHAKHYVEAMAARFGLASDSLVVEIAANDGYLLQYVKAMGIPCLGVEPTARTARAAQEKGIEIIEAFFGEERARQLVAAGKAADLLVANNVLAHVPNINDFLKGFAVLLKPTGVATFEFPSLVRLVEACQFDTIYHEHFSYLSLTSIESIMRGNDLEVFDVETLPTHGGSLRVFAQRADSGKQRPSPSVEAMLRQERQLGVCTADYYRPLQQRAEAIKNAFLSFLLESRQAGLKLAAYGAAAKGNTLLNFAGVRPDLLPYVVDRNAEKQGKYLPGSHIPIVDEAYLKDDRPDRVLILPWNLQQEVAEQLAYIRQWGGKFVVSVPTLSIR